MAVPGVAAEKPLNILHVLRAPLGGLFRHVLDLSREQIRRGHRVGLLADSLTGGPNADRILSELAPQLQLGLRRTPMRRNPHPSDLVPLGQVTRWCEQAGIDVLHGHGSKGGVYVRLSGLTSGRSGPIRVYTPHGGSLNHRPGTVIHRAYMRLERLMAARTDLMLFESGFIADRFISVVGMPPNLFKTVRNGISEQEFEPVVAQPNAADFVYVGELRSVKGLDTLLEALAIAGQTLGKPPRAVLVGSGPDREMLGQHAEQLGLGPYVHFAGAMPARQAFSLGKILLVPSRAESLPYVVLEAVGARLPLIATNVGGIPEIFGPFKDRLIPAGQADLLAARMMEAMSVPSETLAAEAAHLALYVQGRFSIKTMVDGILASYREALERKRSGRRPLPFNATLPSFD